MSESADRAHTARVVMLLAIASFASTSAVRILDPAIPALSDEFGLTTGQSSNVLTAYALTYGVLLFLYGPLGDRFGKYRTLTIAMFACVISNLAIGWSETFHELMLGRMLAAMTGAAIVPLGMAWIGDHIAYADRQATLAQFTIGSILGITTGQFLGGVFTDTVGWRGAFFFLALLYLIVGLLLWTQRHLAPEAPSKRIRLTRVFVPVRSVLSSAWARLVLLTVLFEGAVVFGVLSYIPAYLQFKHAMSATLAGTITSLFAIGAFVYVFRARWLVARLGEGSMVRLGGWVLVGCYAAYLFLDNVVWAVAAAILTGFGYYLIHAVLQTNATQMAPELRGTAVSLASSSLLLGQALGVWLGAFVLDHWGMDWVLVIALICVPLLAQVFAYLLPRLRQQQSEPKSA
jgi:MFS transporter, YNFM family, putative membrane transport protein